MHTVVTNNLVKKVVSGLHIFLLFGILGFTQPEDAAQTEIRRVSFASRSDGQGIVIRLHAKAPLNAYSEPRFDDGNKIEVILFNAKLSDSYRFDSPSDPVTDLQVKERGGHLIFNFEVDEATKVETAAYPDQASNDLLVGVTLLQDDRHKPIAQAASPDAASDRSSADRGQKLPGRQVEKVNTEPVKVVENKVDASKAPETNAKNENSETKAVKIEKAVAKGPLPISAISLTTEEKAEKWTLDTVVIDAGHGGKDPGAIANGVKEKDINLAVALKLGNYLEKFLKMNVVYTRTTDEFVELQERGHIANEAGAKLFISIHANSAPYSSRVTGTETYILGLHRTEKAKEVMERENNVVSMEANPDQYNAFYQNSILRTLALSANLKMSEKLAGEIESQFSNRVHRKSRGVKQAGLIVLWAASMPAVLVELGYLTNRFEAAYLNSHQGQDYLASAIFRAVRDFKHDYEKGLNLPAAN